MKKKRSVLESVVCVYVAQCWIWSFEEAALKIHRGCTHL